MLEPPCQGAREEHVGKLGIRIRAQPRPPSLQLEVVEVEHPAPVRVRAGDDNPRRRGGPEPVEQQIREQERRQVVDRERSLVAVLGQLATMRVGAGVVDQHVDAVVAVEQLLREPADLGQRREVRPQRLNRPPARPLDSPRDRVQPAGISAHRHDNTASPRQLDGGGGADAGASPSNDEDTLPGH